MPIDKNIITDTRTTIILKASNIPFDITWNLERFVPRIEAQACGHCNSIYINVFEGDWDWVGSYTYPGLASCEKCPPKKNFEYSDGRLNRGHTSF